MRLATSVILPGLFLFTIACKKNVTVVTAVAANKVLVYNLGHAGNNTSDLIERLDDVKAVKPNMVIVMIGTNDSEKDTNDFAGYKANLAYLVTALKKINAAVVLMKPPPILHDEERNESLNIICHQIDTVGNQNGCDIIDINRVFTDSLAAGKSIIGDDGIHPNNDGQVLIARTVYTYLDKKTFSGIKIACFGDSITKGGHAKAGYPDILQKLFK